MEFLDSLPRMIAFLMIAVGAIAALFLLSSLFVTSYKDGDGSSLIDDIRHNHKIEKRWKENGRPIVHTSLDWRPDPWDEEDGFKYAGVNDKGQDEYVRHVRGGNKEWTDKYNDLPKSKSGRRS